jgi:phosphopantetheine adenylyltransferase
VASNTEAHGGVMRTVTPSRAAVDSGDHLLDQLEARRAPGQTLDDVKDRTLARIQMLKDEMGEEAYENACDQAVASQNTRIRKQEAHQARVREVQRRGATN